jgi:hypothetical protein
MKKFLCLLVCLVVVGFLLPAQAEAQLRFGFKAYGGLNMLNGGDLNAGAEGWFDFWDYFATAFGNATDGEFSPAKLGLNFGGEILVMFTPNMGVGLGAGMLSAAKESVMEWSNASYNGEFTHTVKASAIPIRLSFYYMFPAGSKMNVFFNAGAGYYLAKANYKFVMTSSGSSPTTMEHDASGGGIGFHGGLGLEYALSPMFGIVAELMGRFASVGGLEGEQRNGTIDEGTLYYLEANLGTQSFPLIGVYDTKPSGSGISDAREAKVGFTGFSFVIGFFVRF